MEPLVGLNCSTIECTSLSPSAPIWQDVLAQGMTGELVAAMNYTSLSEICDDSEEIADALEHAEGERGHAARFAAEGRKIGVDVPNNVDAKHWKRLRDAFLGCITERDFIGCLIVREIMLESFSLPDGLVSCHANTGTEGYPHESNCLPQLRFAQCPQMRRN